MMSFKKVLLASAIAAVSTSAFAMEAMDEGSMSEATGQAGLSISLDTKLTLDMYLHDTDGFTGATDSGALVIQGIAVDNNAAGNAGFKVDIDAGANVATSPVLQIVVSTTTATKFTLGTLKVANSNRTTSGGSWGVTSTSATLVNLGSLSMAATSNLLNIQMGTELQGGWMRVNTTFTNGLSITGFSLNDVAGGAGLSGGGIGFDLTVVDKAGTNLGADILVDATNATTGSGAGLKLTLTKLGAAGTAGGMDIRMANLKLGDLAGTTVVGDVEIIGLNLNGSVVTVAGH